MTATLKVPTAAERVTMTLVDLEEFLVSKGVGANQRDNFTHWAAEWKRVVDRQPGALRPLLDTNVLPGLVEVKHRSSTGAAFFLPVVVAWIVLGIVEMRYGASGSHESFFLWWTGQGMLGPALYSFIIGGLLLLALFLHFGVNAAATHAESIEARLQRDAATLAAAVGHLLNSEVEARRTGSIEAAAIALQRAADRLGGAVDSLQLDRGAIAEYGTAAARASASITTLTDATETLAGAARSLSTTLAVLPGALESADSKLGPVRDILHDLSQRADDLRQRSTDVTSHIESLVTQVLPTTALSVESVARAALLAADSTPAVGQVAAALTKAYEQLAEHQRYSAGLVDRATLLLSYIEDGGRAPSDHEVWPPEAAAPDGVLGT